MPRIFITRLKIHAVFLDKALINTLPIVVFRLSFGLFHIRYSLRLHIHLLNYLLQSISIFPASDGCWRKVPPADQMVGNEDASSACSLAGDFEGDWPLSLGSQEQLSFLKHQERSLIASNTVTIKQVCWIKAKTQFSYVRDLEECCSIYPLISSTRCECLSQ